MTDLAEAEALLFAHFVRQPCYFAAYAGDAAAVGAMLAREAAADRRRMRSVFLQKCFLGDWGTADETKSTRTPMAPQLFSFTPLLAALRQAMAGEEFACETCLSAKHQGALLTGNSASVPPQPLPIDSRLLVFLAAANGHADTVRAVVGHTLRARLAYLTGGSAAALVGGISSDESDSDSSESSSSPPSRQFH